MSDDVAKITATLELEDSNFKSQMDDDQSLAEDLTSTLDDLSNQTLEVDASGITDALNEATDSANNFKDNVTDIEYTEINGDSSGFDSACGEAEGAAKSLEENVQSLHDMMEMAFEVVGAAALLETLDQVGQKVDDLTTKYATLEDTAQRAAMMGGTPVSQMAGATADVYQQAEQWGVQYGLNPNALASGIGMARTYGMPFSKTEAEMAAGMHLDPATVAQVVQATSAATGLTNTQQIADVYSRAYMQTGLDPSAVAMRAIQMLGPNQLGGFTGQVATFEKMQQVMPGVQPAMVASTIDTFTKQVETGAKALTTVLAEAGLGTIDTTSKTDKAGKTTTKTTYDASAELQKDPMQILQDLQTAGQKNGTDYFEQLASGRSGGILRQLAENQEGIKEWKRGLDDAGGSTDDLYNKTDDLQRSMDRMGTSFETMGTETGSLTAGSMKDLSNFISGPMLDSYKKFVDQVKSGDLAGAVKTALDIGGQAQQAIDKWFSAIDWGTVGQELKDGFQTAWESAINEIGSSTSWDNLFSGLNRLGVGIMAAIGPTLEYAFAGMAKYAEGPIVSIEVGFDQIANAAQRDFEFATSAARMLADELGGDLLGAIGAVLYALGDLAGTASVLDPLISALSDINKKVNLKVNESDAANEMYPTGTSPSDYTTQSLGKTITVTIKGKNYQAYVAGSAGGIKTQTYEQEGEQMVEVPDTSIAPSDKGSSTPASSTPASGTQETDVSSSPTSTPSPMYKIGGMGVSYTYDQMQNSIKGGFTSATEWQAASTSQQQNSQAVDTSTSSQQQNSHAVADGTDNTKAQSVATKDTTGALAGLSTQLKQSGDYYTTLAQKYKDDAANIAKTGGVTTQPLDVAKDTIQKQNEYESALYTTDQTVDVLKQGLFESNDAAFKFEDGLYKVDDALTQATNSANTVADASQNASQKLSNLAGFSVGPVGDLSIPGASSVFGNWQEANAGTMFNEAYIGDNAGYAPWLAESETPRGAVHPAVQALGEDYSKPAVKPLQVDTTEAYTGIFGVTTKATTKETMPIAADDSLAAGTVDELGSSITDNPKELPVRLGGVAQVQAIIADLEQDGYKTIYVSVVSSGGGGGSVGYSGGNVGYSNVSPAQAAGTYGGATGQSPIMSTGFPSYAAGTDYVQDTGLALLHEGEAVIPADENTDTTNAYVNLKDSADQVSTTLDQKLNYYELMWEHKYDTLDQFNQLMMSMMLPGLPGAPNDASGRIDATTELWEYNFGYGSKNPEAIAAWRASMLGAPDLFPWQSNPYWQQNTSTPWEDNGPFPFTSIGTSSFNPGAGAGNINFSSEFMNFDEGGIVPGSLGRPNLAIVHGGERVQTPGQQAGTGGVGSQIVYAPSINGVGLSMDEVQAVLRADHEEFKRSIEQENFNGQWR